MENNFHHRCHRKVATRHTLPNIQMSLSLRKFSMMKTFLFLSLLSACTGCVSYFSLSAACGEGVSGGGQQVVDMGRDSRHWLWNTGSRASVAVHWMLSLLLSTDSDENRGLCCQVTCPPSQPFTLHPASSLPPTPGPKRRGHAVCETRRWQVVLGSGCRCCMQNQMPAAAAGMLARPLRCPLTLDTALHAYMYFCPAVALPLCISQTDRIVCLHHCRCIQWQTCRQSRAPVSKHLQLCGVQFVLSVPTRCTGENKTSAEVVLVFSELRWSTDYLPGRLSGPILNIF